MTHARAPAAPSRRALLAAASAAAAAAALGARARAALRIAPGGVLRLPMPAAAAAARAPAAAAALFDPARATDLAHAWALALSHETLAGGEREGYPLLERPPARDPQDARAVQVALRGGMLYASGEPVTAASVAAAWGRARATALGRLALALCAPPAPFDVAAPLVLRVRLAGPDTLDELLAAWPLAPASPRAAAGLGPFVPRADGVALLRNPRAAAGPPFLERVDLLAPRARNDEVRAFATGGADGSWRAAGLYEVSRPAQEVRGAPGLGAVVGLVPTPRGALDRADAGRALEAVLGPGLTAGAAAAAAPLPFGPDGGRPAPAAAGALLARLAPQVRLARDPLDAFLGSLGERVVALLDAVGVPVALLDPGAVGGGGGPPPDATLRAIAPIVAGDPAFALASFVAVAGDEAGAQSVARAPRAARQGAAAAAWARSSAAVIGRLAPRLFLRDDVAGAAFDPAGRLRLGDAYVRPAGAAARPREGAMSLRTRLVLALLACALLPVTSAGLFARPVLTQYFERIEARRRDAAITRVDRAIATRAEALSRALARFCAHDYLVDRTLLQLQTGQYTAASRDELGAVLPEVAAALGLDTLSLVRETGEVLASAHYPGRAGASDPATFLAAQGAPRGQSARAVRTVRVRGERGPRDILALEALCVARRGPVAIAVAGGLVLDDRLVSDARDEGLAVRVVPGEARPARAPGVMTRVLPLRGEGGVTAASVVVSTSDAQLRAVLADLDGLVVLTAILAASIAVLLALVLASPLARPISEVAAAADRIAQGNRSVHIDARAGGEAGRLVRAFNHMARELDAADARLRRVERVAAWRDIARQMAHEIKNPLTPIQMAVEMLRKARERDLPDFDQLFDEETRIVLEEVARLRRLVENFSRFARAPRPRLEAVSVAEVVAHVVGLQAAAGVAEVTGEAEAALPLIRADREQLTQVLVNLAGNAAFAAAERAQRAPEKGPAAVHVSARNLRDGRVAIAVDDNGAGIAPAVMDRLFEPYVTTKQGQGGTGLGLAIAFRIVTDHGGTITPETSPDGTRFDVVLPVAGPSQVDTTLESEDRRVLASGGGGGGGGGA